MEPPEAHIHHFALAQNNSIVGNSCSCGIVCLDMAFRLGFGHRCHYKLDDLGNRESCINELQEGVLSVLLSR
jgi:hypothetical protein